MSARTFINFVKAMPRGRTDRFTCLTCFQNWHVKGRVCLSQHVAFACGISLIALVGSLRRCYDTFIAFVVIFHVAVTAKESLRSRSKSKCIYEMNKCNILLATNLMIGLLFNVTVWWDKMWSSGADVGLVWISSRSSLKSEHNVISWIFINWMAEKSRYTPDKTQLFLVLINESRG
jgi:hypothetical protein